MEIIDKTFLRDLILEAARPMAQRHADGLFYAAPLANEIQKQIRDRLQDPNATLSGHLFGPALYPNLSAHAHGNLKFRNLLEAFPDIFEVIPTSSGDRVRLIGGLALPDRADLGPKSRQKLVEILLELQAVEPEPGIYATQLAKLLKKAVPEFEAKAVGATGFQDWLSKQSDIVEIIEHENGSQIRLRKGDATESNFETGNSLQTGYILVDSVDILASLHSVVGGRPSTQQMPDWAQLLRFLKDRFPGTEWKGRYFMAIGRLTESTEGFQKYLEAVGFKVVQISAPLQAPSSDELQAERSRVCRVAIEKMISAVSGLPAHLVVLSHDAGLAPSLRGVLAHRSADAKVIVIGFTERISKPLSDLKFDGLSILDAEFDAHIFKQALPRRLMISAEDFDPRQFL
jgi:hypothetical protein